MSMERLTKKHYGGNGYYMACSEHCNKECFDCKEIDKIIDRLAAYEDTGLEPEEIYEVRFLIAAQRDPQKLARLRELVLADQDGRLHITPAFVWHNGDSGLHEVPYKPWMAQWIATGTKFWLTREEAEAALAQKGASDGKENT